MKRRHVFGFCLLLVGIGIQLMTPQEIRDIPLVARTFGIVSGIGITLVWTD
jgi:hypothetical protein